MTPRARGLSIASTTLLVLMPKCPFCLVAWMGALGLGGYATNASILTRVPTAVLVVFCASQAAFFFTARRTRDVRSLVVAALGVMAVLAGTQLHLGAAVCGVGVALLLLASVLNAVATRASLSERGSSHRSQRGTPCHPSSRRARRA